MQGSHNYDKVLQKLKNVREHQWGWTACCPAHDDSKSSLALRLSSDGKLFVKCHAEQGCTFEMIVQALGLEQTDFFPPRESNGRSKIVKTYDYTDAKGNLLFQVVRFEPKDFRQRRKPRPGEDPKRIKGDWVWSLDGVPKVLYGLPELLAADPHRAAFVLEGEKDCDNAREKLNLLCTTNPCGAGKWSLCDDKPLHGRPLIIIPDNDPVDAKTGQRPGWRHAIQVAIAMWGKVPSIRIVRLPDLPEKGDISDWIAAGGTVEKLQELVKSTEPLTDREIRLFTEEIRKYEEERRRGPAKAEEQASKPAAQPVKERSGKFLVRIPKSLHASLAVEADEEGVSLNQLAVAKLSVPLSEIARRQRDG